MGSNVDIHADDLAGDRLLAPQEFAVAERGQDAGRQDKGAAAGNSGLDNCIRLIGPYDFRNSADVLRVLNDGQAEPLEHVLVVELAAGIVPGLDGSTAVRVVTVALGQCVAPDREIHDVLRLVTGKQGQTLTEEGVGSQEDVVAAELGQELRDVQIGFLVVRQVDENVCSVLPDELLGTLKGRELGTLDVQLDQRAPRFWLVLAERLFMDGVQRTSIDRRQFGMVERWDMDQSRGQKAVGDERAASVAVRKRTSVECDLSLHPRLPGGNLLPTYFVACGIRFEGDDSVECDAGSREALHQSE